MMIAVAARKTTRAADAGTGVETAAGSAMATRLMQVTVRGSGSGRGRGRGGETATGAAKEGEGIERGALKMTGGELGVNACRSEVLRALLLCID
jgi:hypothetical protein